MSEPVRVGLGFWPPAVEALLDEACDQFEAACQKAGLSVELPCIEDYLADVAGPERVALLQELIPLDMHYRRQRGETPRPEEYHGRFPGLDPQWLAGAVEVSQAPGAEVKSQVHTGPWPVAASTPPKGDTLPPAAENAEEEVRVPGYEVLGELGRGGMGVVYKARQQSLNRVVALKMILAGEHAAPEQIIRFRAEAEAVARMQHPHIVQVYEVGEHAGRSFIALEFCPGGSLAERFQGQPQPARTAATLVRTLAGAVQHAHEHGIIHRDLKPANVLLAEDDTLKVSDFGLAKQLDAQGAQTQSGVIVGTPSYMAPEQTAGRSAQIGSATDVYALGAILYEALTGRPPFRAATPLETLEQVRSQEPVAVRQLQPQVPKDLETICQKCLQKEPTKRYASAAALADDLGRFLAGQPILARPVGHMERLWRWGKRNPVVAGLTAAVFMLLAAVAGVATVGYMRARAAEQEIRRQWYAASCNAMQQAWDSGQVGRLRALLADTETYPDRGFEWNYWQRLCHRELHNLIGHRARVTAVSWSPDGKRLATASGDGTAKVWETASGQELFTVRGHTSGVTSLSWSPDGGRLATAGGDGVTKVWDGISGRELLALKRQSSGLWAVCWSPDGRFLATAGDLLRAKVWDAASGRELRTLCQSGRIVAIAWSPDGRFLLTGSYEETTKVWDVWRGREVLSPDTHLHVISSVSWSPDGKFVATGGSKAKVWEVAGGREWLTLQGHAEGSNAVSWSPGGGRLATTSRDGTANVWEISSGRKLLTFGHTSPVSCVCWSPDGKRLATGSEDGTARVWEAVGGAEPLTLQRGVDPITVGWQKSLRAVSWSPDSKRLALRSQDGKVKMWEIATSRELLALGHVGRLGPLSWSPDGERMAIANGSDVTVCKAAGDGEPVTLKGHTHLVRSVSWSPDSKRLATGGVDGTARVWDAATGRQLLEITGHGNLISCVSWSPDGQRLATSGGTASTKVWNAADGRELVALQGHTGGVPSVSWSPDGQRLATGSWDGTAKVWDATSGQELLTLKGHAGAVNSVFWSPDGKRLATGSEDRTVRVWETARGRELLTLKGHTDTVGSLSWSPDGQRLATESNDGAVKVWEAASAEAVHEWARQDRAREERLARNTFLGPQAQGFIQDWLLLLPVPFLPGESGGQTLDRQLPGERGLRPLAGHPVRIGDQALVWQKYHSPDAVLDFNAVLGKLTERYFAYAACYLKSDRARNDLWLQVGSDDQAKVSINGRDVYQFRIPRALVGLETIGPLSLEQGTNVLLFQVASEGSDWLGCIRLADAAGRPVQGIRFTLTPEPWQLPAFGGPRQTSEQWPETDRHLYTTADLRRSIQCCGSRRIPSRKW